MKKQLIAAAMMLSVLTVNAQKQAPPNPEERLRKTNEMLQKELNMDASQQKAVEAAFKDFFAAMETLRKDNPPPPPPPPDPAIKDQVDKLAKERDAKIQKVLSADQYQKYLETEKKMRPQKPEGNQPPPPPQP